MLYTNPAKNKGAGARVSTVYKIRMRYLAAEMGLAALKNWQQFFLNGASQYAHGDLCIRNAIHVVALSADLL